MDTLHGYAMQAKNFRHGDHTYVISSAGHSWGCFGRKSGGVMICYGQGDAQIADCLSRPNSTAGIKYGRTGFCHQAANRILHPAGILVAQAAGYPISVMFFGHYGRGHWYNLSQCYRTSGGGSSSGGTSGHGGGIPMAKGSDRTKQDKKLFSRVRSQYAPAFANERSLSSQRQDFNREEIKTLVNYKLGKNYDKEKRDKLIEDQLLRRQIQEELSLMLSTGKISPEDYAEALDEQIIEAFNACLAIIGRRDCIEFMGGDLENIQNLFDKKKFLKLYKSG